MKSSTIQVSSARFGAGADQATGREAMPTLFTRIVEGELPARFVYTDDVAAAFLSISPVTPGHTLVVPRQEVDQWTDAAGPLLHHCLDVAKLIGNAAKQAFGAPRAGLVIAGLEVPHLHVHVFPAWTLDDFNIAQAKPTSDDELDQTAARLRAALEHP
jgi:diadenosine tetraphosphate (Ap4A) HIT family hydrolase